MKYHVDVKDEKSKAFEKVMEAMKELKVVREFARATEGSPRLADQGQKPGRKTEDPPTQDFLQQYRDLVD